MTVNTEREGDTIIASLSGRVEGGTSAAEFQEDLQSLAGQEARAVVLDCRELAYISSSGLRAIAILLNDTEEQGMRLEACEMTLPVRKVFEMSGFDQLIGVHDTREEACRAARGEAAE